MQFLAFLASPLTWGVIVGGVVLALWLFVFGPDAQLRRALRRLAAATGDIRIPAEALRESPGRARAAAARALALLDAGKDYDAATLFTRTAGETGGAAKAELLNLAGVCHYLAGRHAAAAESYERCAREAGEAGAGRVQAAGFANLALLRLAQNEHDLARAAQEQALALDREAGDRVAAAAGLGRLGLAWQAKGETARALDLQLEALALDEAAGNRRGVATALGRIGLAYQVQGEHEMALDYYRRGLETARKAGYHAGAAEFLGNIGLLHLERDETGPALDSLLDALALFGARGDTARAVNTVSGLALARGKMGRAQFDESCRKHGVVPAELARLSALLDRVAVKQPRAEGDGPQAARSVQ